MISIFSPKGGVGKTTVAVNLALALTDNGSRKVCLVDFDLAFGDVAITLQLFPSHTVEHAIGSEDDLDAPMLNSLLTRYQDTLQVLAAPSHPDVRERISPLLISKVLRTLRTMYDFVVVDTAPAFDEQTLTALDETDECIIVATLDVPDAEEREGRPGHARDAQHRPRAPLPPPEPRRRRRRHRRGEGGDDPRDECRVADLDLDRHRGRHQRRHADHRGQPAPPVELGVPGLSTLLAGEPAGRAGRWTAPPSGDQENDRFAKLFRIKR